MQQWSRTCGTSGMVLRVVVDASEAVEGGRIKLQVSNLLREKRDYTQLSFYIYPPKDLQFVYQNRGHVSYLCNTYIYTYVCTHAINSCLVIICVKISNVTYITCIYIYIHFDSTWLLSGPMLPTFPCGSVVLSGARAWLGVHWVGSCMCPCQTKVWLQ